MMHGKTRIDRYRFPNISFNQQLLYNTIALITSLLINGINKYAHFNIKSKTCPRSLKRVLHGLEV